MGEQKVKKRHLSKLLKLFLGIVIIMMIAIPITQNIIIARGNINSAGNGKEGAKVGQIKNDQSQNDFGQLKNLSKQLQQLRNSKTITGTNKETKTKPVSVKKKKQMIDVIKNVNLHKNPDDEAKVLYKVKKGEKLEFIKEAGYGWLKVIYKGKKLYVYYLFTNYKNPKEKVLLDEQKGKTLSKTKLLAAPGLDSEVVAEVKKGTYVDLKEYVELVKDEFDGWYKAVDLKTGNEGYIQGKDLNCDVTYTVKFENSPQPEQTANPDEKSESSLKPEQEANLELQPESSLQPEQEANSELKTERSLQSKSSNNVNNSANAEDNLSEAKEKETDTFCAITAQATMKLHKEPNRKSKVIKIIHKGAKLENVSKSTRAWLKVTVNGVEGYAYYLHTNYAEVASKKPVLKKSYKDTYAIVDGNSVNLRSAPGVTSKVECRRWRGSELKVLKHYELIKGEKYGWFKVIDVVIGKKLYIYGKYVKIKDNKTKKSNSNKNQSVQKQKDESQNNGEKSENSQNEPSEGEGGATADEKSSANKKQEPSEGEGGATADKKQEPSEGEGGATADKKQEPSEGEGGATADEKSSANKKQKPSEGEGGSSKKGFYKGVKLQFTKAYKITSNPLNKRDGVKWFKGHLESYYEKEVKPGHGLKIPGRHVSKEDGTIRDKDGFICVSANKKYMKYGSTLMTSLGPAKVYDCGVPKKVIDVYVSRKYFR